MATIDLGKVALVWKGTYAAGTTYESKDVVQFTDSGEVSSYIYVNASGASGQTPSTGGTVNTTYWDKMAGGTSLSVGNSKIVTTDASGNVTGQSIGTAGQVLKVNSGANGFEFGTGAKYLKTQMWSYGGRSGVSSTAARTAMWNVGAFAKTQANSTLRIAINFRGGGTGTTYPHFNSEFIRLSTTGFSNDGSDLFGYIANTRATTNNMGANLLCDFLYDTTGTNVAAAGNVYITVGYHSASGACRPFPMWNPDSNEDARGRPSISTVVVDEIE